MLEPQEILKKMSPRDRARFLMGLDAWYTYPLDSLNVPKVLMTDGPHGIRRQYDTSTPILSDAAPATCFPTASATACSFNTGLLYDIGTALGEEAREQGVSLLLCPGVNIKRSPLCGRNFEYFSEDPLLSGKIGAAMANGLQNTGVGACEKHFVANNREYFRMISNSVVDPRALHEIYLKPFKIVINEAKPYAVMSAYNRVNGNYAGESPWLIIDILRGALGFDGIVVSDWGAVDVRVNGVIAGQDLEMPHSGLEHTNQLLKEAAANPRFSQKIDDCVLRLLHFIDKCEKGAALSYECDMEAHHNLARRAAEESAVLLKNDGAVLPLDKSRKIAVIGQLFKNPRYQGMGSSYITPACLESLPDEFNKAGITYVYSDGYNLQNDSADASLIQSAVKLSEDTDTALIFAGLPSSWEVEGVDRTTLALPDCQNELIAACAKAFKNVAVVLMGGSVMELNWADDVSAILHMHLSGEAYASAAVNLLYGSANPSGRLAETYPLKLSDNPSYYFFDNDPYNVEYRESIYVGYTYYDAVNKPVRFPFGFGLSYTTFDYSDFSVLTDEEDGCAEISFNIKNTGAVPGAEIPQLYVTGLQSPELRLAAFTKVYILPGETVRVTLCAEPDAFKFFRNGQWVSQSKRLMVGKSAQDILYAAEVHVKGAQEPPAYPPAADGRWNQQNFYELFNGDVPLIAKPKKPFGMNATLYDVEATAMGSLINAVVESYIEKNFRVEDHDMNAALYHTMKENPFRSHVSMSAGMFTYDMAQATLRIANGRPITGLFRWIAAIIRKKIRPSEERNG